ncbi:MAG: YqaE/Pmp3 family membrane protein [Flavobacteriales bacterium]|nr:YqaE/Pmp3 family membrane protein [Flavobacteriales bacterium]
MFILAVICAILLPPLGVGIYTNIDWMKVLICFLLTLLFFLPGMIYALLVVFDVI